MLARDVSVDSSPEICLHFKQSGDSVPADIAKELYLAIRENHSRSLIENQIFFSELYACIDDTVEADDVKWRPSAPPSQYNDVRFIHSLLVLDEWKRVEHFTQKKNSPLIAFYHFYARLRKAEAEARGLLSANNLPFQGGIESRMTFTKIIEDIEAFPDYGKDGYINFIRAKVLLFLRKRSEAREAIIASLNEQPYNWQGWLLLQKFVSCKESLNDISAHLKEHWLKQLFLADVKCSIIPLVQEEDVTATYQEMLETFKDSTYILSQMAIAQQNQRQVYSALRLFKKVRQADPYRLQQMDVYSNLLYVRGAETELTSLAHFVVDVNKYARESCAVVANFFALRGQHDKAVEYYRRALKVDPEYSQGWTLMGHECVELKDTTSAIEAYRQATNINENDYYAWYGLGQLFEVLKMPYFALRYHQKAHALRPTDSRIVVAMGDCYSKIGKIDDAKQCYYKAYQIGDIEGMVLYNLAKLHEDIGEKEIARECYRKFLDECEERMMNDVEELGDAYLYTARALLEEGKLDDALLFAQKCYAFGSKREKCKMVIKEISAARESEPVERRNLNSTVGFA